MADKKSNKTATSINNVNNSEKIVPTPLIELTDKEWKEYWKFKPTDFPKYR